MSQTADYMNLQPLDFKRADRPQLYPEVVVSSESLFGDLDRVNPLFRQAAECPPDWNEDAA